jgi:hypothetical protein
MRNMAIDETHDRDGTLMACKIAVTLVWSHQLTGDKTSTN